LNSPLTVAPTQDANALLESVFDVRVYYEDTDAGGVVFYANYLKFFERARTEMFRKLGVVQSTLAQSTGCIFVVRSLDMDYRRPARLDDLLTIHTRITKIGAASLDFAQTATCHGELLSSGTIKVCAIDAKLFKPTELPNAVRAQLKASQE